MVTPTTEVARPPLFSTAVALGPVTARNRVFFAPTSVGYAQAGVLGRAAVEHYGRRAQGGVGAVMTEQLAVSEAGWQHPRQPGIWAPRHADGLRTLAAEIHSHGALAIAQLSHTGRYAGPWDRYAERRRLAPSAVAFPLPTGEVRPAEITPTEISTAIGEFAIATRMAVDAGFDGVEIHGGSGFLVATFLSPRTNRRTDAYADLTRFALEVASACRDAGGRGLAVGFHLMTDELMADGIDLDAALALVPALQDAGIDFLRPGQGTFESLRAPHNAGHSARAQFQHADTVAVTRVASVPVLAGGGITTSAQVERILAAGEAAAVALARPLLADPDWVAKSRAGVPPVHCACSPAMCLSTQLSGAVCAAWSEPVRRRGWSGYKIPAFHPHQEDL